MLLALFMWVEPIIVGAMMDIQWLIIVWIGNLLLILLRSKSQTHTKAPLSQNLFGYKSNFSHLQTHNTYFGVIALIAVVGGVVAYILWGHETLGNLALGLTTAGIVYWIAAWATHGLRATRKHALGKIFALLIIVWLGWVFLGSSNGQSFVNDFPTNFRDLFTVPTAVAPTGTWEDAMISGNNTSGDIMSGGNAIMTEWTTGSMSTSWDTTVMPVEDQPTATVQPSTDKTLPNPAKTNPNPLTFAQSVPAIVSAFNLPSSWPDVPFTNIPVGSEYYAAFKAWYRARFFGQWVNPQNITSCNVYFVMLGLAQNWNVQYSASNIFPAYAAEATRRGQTYWCKPWALVTEANLPW